MLQIAITLLISAQSLLGLVNANPGLPQSFKDNAIQTATSAIAYAQTAIQASSQSTQVSEVAAVSSQVAPGQDFTQTIAQPIAQVIPVQSQPELNILTTTPTMTINQPVQVDKDDVYYTSRNEGELYTLHFDTTSPATAEFDISFDMNGWRTQQVFSEASTTFDFTFTNLWGMTVFYRFVATQNGVSKTVIGKLI